jgi:hypothetical protein
VELNSIEFQSLCSFDSPKDDGSFVA